MIVPISWLKEYVEIDITPQELETRLFDCGFEVETLTELGSEISGVVVGHVTECEPIPETHLSVCKVDCGAHGTFQICCGADNVKVGGKYPAALVGAQVYATARDHVTVEGTMKIKKGKLKGYESHGMLCSGIEIGLNEDLYPGADYCGLLVLPEDAPVGADIKPIVGLNDWIFDISITANRPDCMSVLGIAREVAAALGKPLKMPATDYKTDGSTLDFKVTVEAPELCPRYQAHYVRDVRIAQSPAWMRRRLALVGIRSISNIVDITNYVLKEIGQPMHAFDLRNLDGQQIIVRRAKQDEKIVTLDEKEFTLNPNNLVICDGEKPVALAGIMGGLNSEIKDDTCDVVFESAKFMRDNVRKTGRALGQHSDSSQRFEKGVDEYATQLGLKRALHLIDELGCGTVTDSDFCEAVKADPTATTPLTVSIAKINALLGITIPDDEILRILKNLDFAPEINGDSLSLQIPAYREDIENAPDIAEELIRMYGYDHIKPTFLAAAAVTNGGRNAAQSSTLKLKRTLAAQGLYECIHYSFYSPKDLDLLRIVADAPQRNAIRILNPISEDLSIMRTILAPSMLNAVIRNVRRGNDAGRLFEIAKTYHADDPHPKTEPEEREALSIGLFDGGKLSFFDGKAVIESIAEAFRLEFAYRKPEDASKYPFLHPGMSAEILLDGAVIGWAGMLAHDLTDAEVPDHAVFLAELDLTQLASQLRKPVSFAALPKFPVVQRDIALLVGKDVICADLEACMKRACKSLNAVRLFDIYQGKQIEQGKQSLAFSLWFRSDDHALTDAEVDQFVAKILKNLGKEFEATQR